MTDTMWMHFGRNFYAGNDAGVTALGEDILKGPQKTLYGINREYLYTRAGL